MRKVNGKVIVPTYVVASVCVGSADYHEDVTQSARGGLGAIRRVEPVERSRQRSAVVAPADRTRGRGQPVRLMPEIKLLVAFYGPWCPECLRWDCEHDPGTFYGRIRRWVDAIPDEAVRAICVGA